MLGRPYTTNLNWACSSHRIWTIWLLCLFQWFVTYTQNRAQKHILLNARIEHKTILAHTALAYCVRDVITTKTCELHSKMEGSLEYLVTGPCVPFLLIKSSPLLNSSSWIFFSQTYHISFLGDFQFALDLGWCNVCPFDQDWF